MSKYIYTHSKKHNNFYEKKTSDLKSYEYINKVAGLYE